MSYYNKLITILIVLFSLIFSFSQSAAGNSTIIRAPEVNWTYLKPPKFIPRWEQFTEEDLRLTPFVTPPPSEPVRWTAQWEDREGVLLAWPLYWQPVDSAYCYMVEELQEIGTVYLLHNNTIGKYRISDKLASCGVSEDNIEWLDIPYRSNWTRDYGPQNIWGQNTGNWGIVDNRYLWGPKDNNVNPNLHTLWGMDYYESPIVTEGGNLCTDGLGKVFATSWIRAENFFMSEDELRNAFSDYLNVELIILPWPQISPHLDMSAKLVDPETWIVGQWPPDDPNTPKMDEMVAILESMTASTGNPYTIYRVQQPDRLSTGYWRTYTNAYMQNGKVLVPIFDVEQDDDALSVFQKALPGWEIIGINCTGFDGTGGAIHCSTHGIASHDEIEFLKHSGIRIRK